LRQDHVQAHHQIYIEKVLQSFFTGNTVAIVLGSQGSGKTTVAAELVRQGHPTIDSDNISHWVDEDGHTLTENRPTSPSDTWLRTHAWVWDRTKLHECLSQTLNHPLLLCGISWDQDQYYDLFDKIILLQLDGPTVRQRLLTRDNGSIFGKQPHELRLILEKLESFQNQAKAAGAVVIDAREPLEAVVEEIVRAIS
jgi:dephospho-CoA kinase